MLWYAPKRFWNIINQTIEERLYGEEPEERAGRFDYIKSLRIPKIPTPRVEVTEKGKTLLLVGLVLIAFLASSNSK